MISNQDLIEALSAKTGYKAEEWHTGGGCMNAVLLLDTDHVDRKACYLMFPAGGWPTDSTADQTVGLFNDMLFGAGKVMDIDDYDSEGVNFAPIDSLTTATEVAEWIGGLLARFFTA